MKLEYFKVVIRSVLASLVGKSRRDLAQQICETESELNDMHCLKERACSMKNCERKSVKITHINPAINRLDCDLSKLRVRQSSETSFRARTNWYEHGEKSNKYFLNLKMKYKKRSMLNT